MRESLFFGSSRKTLTLRSRTQAAFSEETLPLNLVSLCRSSTSNFAVIEYSITAKFEVDERQSETRFKGKVSSEKAACVRERKVKVFREEPKKSDSRIGTVFTKRSGKWILEPGEVVEDGDYYAKIP